MAEPTRDEVAAWTDATLLEFGASWCPICAQARPMIDGVRKDEPDLRYLWVEDGPGRPLGRSFRVKLWPTLVLLRDGVEVGRVVRPTRAEQLRELLADVGSGGG